jgi:hypothetical protein
MMTKFLTVFIAWASPLLFLSAQDPGGSISEDPVKLTSLEVDGEGIGPNRELAHFAARQDAMSRAIRELYREEGLAAPLQAVADRLAALDRSLGGFLASETLASKWDEKASLASVRLKVEADIAAFRRAASRALRVQVVCTGLLSDQIASRFKERLTAEGFEVVLGGAREGVDAIVIAKPVLEQLPGGEAGFYSWRGALTVEVVSLSVRDDATIVLADRRFEPENPTIGSNAREVARKTILPFCAEAADLAARRILNAASANARWTIIVEGAEERYLVEDLLDAITLEGASLGVVGVSSLSWDPPNATFRLVLDRRGANRLGGIMGTLDLSEGRRVRVLREANSTMIVKIESS